MSVGVSIPVFARSEHKPLLLLGKIGITAVLIGWLVIQADWADIARRLAHAPFWPLFWGLAISFVGVAFAGERWRAACGSAAIGIGPVKSLMLMTSSLFFGQVLPGAIGGDAVRGWLTWRETGEAVQKILVALVLDRFLALFAVSLLLLVGLPRLLSVVPAEAAWALPRLIPLGLAVGLAGLMLDRFPFPATLRQRRLAVRIFGFLARFRSSLFSRPAALALAHGVLVHVSTLAATLLYAQAIGLSIGPGDLLAVMPTAIIAAALPISLNGWGVREGTMVAGFALFGVGFEDALLLSLMIGLSVTLTALPGGLCWLALVRSRPSPSPASTDTTNDR